ncbi:MAG: DUF4062 domain-containing protein [Caldilineaceae bacterium]|nr:DUF4062 domain-containing protein [Caldilineaceae bacterium]
MKVFVSSVIKCYKKQRDAAETAIECLGHTPILMERTYPVSPESPQVACLTQVEDSDVVVLLLGSDYGDKQESDKSATHEEWDHARSINKRVLVFVEKVEEREPAQEEFVQEVSGWEDGHWHQSFCTPEDLVPKIVKALRRVESSTGDSAQDPSEFLPPACRERVKALRSVCSITASRVVSWLSDHSTRNPGVLSGLVDDPPHWLIEVDALAWEAIAEYMDAHGLEGSEQTRQRAIQAGTPRRVLYFIRGALVAAQEGDNARVQEMLDRVPADHPLLPAALARIADDAQAVAEAVQAARLTASEDPDVALDSLMWLVWAYWELKKYSLARETLRAANQRFPGRGSLLYHEANSTLGMAEEAGLESPSSRDLLHEAVGLALESRDCFRIWGGPSHEAVALATNALLFLEDPWRAVDVASEQPAGEATEAEASSPEVRGYLARALLMLGRHDEIDSRMVEGLDASEAALIRGMQAQGLGQDVAESRMRRAVAEAQSEASLRKALWGLAMVGEVDEKALSRVTDVDATLFRGVSAFYRDDMPEVIRCLRHHRFASLFHAQFFAQAQYRDGQPAEAIKTLLEASDSFGDEMLLEAAAIYAQTGRWVDAEPIAVDVLSRNPARAVKRRVLSLLVEITAQLRDWPKMESYARAWTKESPQDAKAGWMVVYALHSQVKNPHAWAYMVGNDLVPIDEDTARIAIAVSGLVEISTGDFDRLLNIVDGFAESEEIAGVALMTLLTVGDRINVTDEQKKRLGEVLDDFFARYPESNVLRAFDVEEPEEVWDVMATLQSQSEHVDSLFDHVRYGRIPYGVLLWVKEMPYASALLSLIAGSLTAIPADENQRAWERQVACQALGGKVVADTSVGVVGLAAELDLGCLIGEFDRVLVADELIQDARRAVLFAQAPVSAVGDFDPLDGRPILIETDQAQRQAKIERAESLVALMESWHPVRSGRLPSPADLGEEEHSFRPWDASIRVAMSRDCALWCDDLGLRTMARLEGIPAFGTWALYEHLLTTAENTWLPPPTELKIRLLEARIAEIPIALSDLAQAPEYSQRPEVAVNFYLSRPLVWGETLTDTFEWYLERVRMMRQGPQQSRTSGLLYAACYGRGAAVPEAAQIPAIGGLLAATVLTVNDPATTPQLVIASRYAAKHLKPRSDEDPLPGAVRQMLTILENQTGSGQVAQTIMRLFEEASPADRRTVTSIVVGDR